MPQDWRSGGIWILKTQEKEEKVYCAVSSLYQDWMFKGFSNDMILYNDFFVEKKF